MTQSVFLGVLAMGAFPVVLLLFGWLLLSQSRFFTLPRPIKIAIFLTLFAAGCGMIGVLFTDHGQVGLLSLAIFLSACLSQLSSDPGIGRLRWPGRLLALALFASALYGWLSENPPFAGDLSDTLYFLFMAALLIGMAGWEAYRRLHPKKADNASTTGTGTPA